jgi:hypothetical protein
MCPGKFSADADTRFVADSRIRGNESTATLQQGQSVISLRSQLGHFRPDAGVHRTEENSKKENNRQQNSEVEVKEQQ